MATGDVEHQTDELLFTKAGRANVRCQILDIGQLSQNAMVSLEDPCSRPSVFSALDCRQNIIFNVSDGMTMALALCAVRPRVSTNIDFTVWSQRASLQLPGAHHAPACCENTRNRPQISSFSNKQLHLDAKTTSPRSIMATCTVLMSPWEPKPLNGGDG